MSSVSYNVPSKRFSLKENKSQLNFDKKKQESETEKLSLYHLMTDFFIPFYVREWYAHIENDTHSSFLSFLQKITWFLCLSLDYMLRIEYLVIFYLLFIDRVNSNQEDEEE